MRYLLLVLLTFSPLFGANALINEESPYLQQHANNPVNWYPYTKEAFALAKKEHKPIFLSIGYSTCHWCHVMAHESFENKTIAALMNRDYIAIKVDREEMPHIDTHYQQMFLKLKKRSGGWPLNVILDEEGKAFYIATYIPPTFMYDHEGMDTLLVRLAKAYRENRGSIKRQSDAIASLMKRKTSDISPRQPTQKTIFTALEKQYDFVFYGFRRMPKYPEAAKIDLLFTLDALREPKAKEMALNMLDAMALRGLYDPVDGGFFRYSTDEGWEIPHFEKMLYNQAELIPLYIKAYQRTSKSLYLDIVKETIAMVERRFVKDGLFLSASDADSDHLEGGYFIFTPQEIQKALKNNPHKESIMDAYDLDMLPNFKSHYHLINTEHQRPKDFLSFIKNLQAIRTQKSYPFIDTKIITSWNAMMIQALYSAAYFDTKYLKNADRHLEALWRKHYKKGRLYHQSLSGKPAHQTALLEDYAFLIAALIEGYEHTYDAKKLKRATTLMDEAIEKFYHDAQWYLNEEGLHIKADLRDKYYTSALGKTLQNLFRLAALNDNLRYIAIARRSLKALHVSMHNNLANTPAADIALLMQKYGVISLKHSKEILTSHYKQITQIHYPFIVTKADDAGLFLACETQACFAYGKDLHHVSQAIEKRLDKIPHKNK